MSTGLGGRLTRATQPDPCGSLLHAGRRAVLRQHSSVRLAAHQPVAQRAVCAGPWDGAQQAVRGGGLWRAAVLQPQHTTQRNG